jgi:hypothetical protein
MNPLNPAFMSTVNAVRVCLNELLIRAKVQKLVYPSKHFAERLVERNLSAEEAFVMLVPVIREFRGSTYNERVIGVHYRQNTLVAQFKTGCVSGERKIVLKTIFDKNDDRIYDAEIKL